jgi:peptidoglycan/LPS O-acetylase OafA/YrhL/CheY-like chemotaxis protein
MGPFRASSSGPKRLAAIEGLRGYLALWVLVCHVLWSSGYDADAMSLFPKLLAKGRYAVEVFMIISGFVIFFLLDMQNGTYKQFIVRRFFRIFPAFLLLFIVAIPTSLLLAWNTAHTPYLIPGHAHELLVQVRSWWSNVLWHVPVHLLLLHGAVPPAVLPYSSMAFLAPAWSLSTEWQFYIVAPFAFAFAAGSRPSLRIALCTTCVFTLIAARVVAHAFPQFHSDAALPGVVEFFFIGAASYFLYKRNAAKPFFNSALPVFASVGIFVFLLAGIQRIQLAPIIIWIIFLGLLLEHPASQCARVLSPLFTHRWPQFLGRISYSLYLSHMLLMVVAQYLILKLLPGLSQVAHVTLLLGATSLLSIVASAALYRWIEAPATAFGKEIARGLGCKPLLQPEAHGFTPPSTSFLKPGNSTPVVKSHHDQNGIILLAEDREEDAALFTRAFRQAGITNPVVTVSDGDDAIAYLEGVGKYANRPLPLILVLDLKMPNRDGFQVLQWIRDHPTLRALRVIVITVSESIYDVNRAYQLGANSFVVKTPHPGEMIEQAKQIKIHWLDTPAPDLVRLRIVCEAS